MQIGMIGLGKMGGNMVRRLRAKGLDVVGYDPDAGVVSGLEKEVGMQPSSSLDDMVSKLPVPRVVWVMVPSGAATESTLEYLRGSLQQGDLVVDGGNSNYRDTMKQGEAFSAKSIQFIDVGTSGGVWGLENGYCMMAGGTQEAISLLEPVLKALAPADDRGWAHVGPVGSGHFVKMIHNGIEYGMMQAFAEGFAIMEHKKEFELDLAQIAELWRHSSVVRSWLLDLTADGLKENASLNSIAPFVADSGEGRWTANEAIDLGVAAPVMTLALHMRFASQDDNSFSNRMLSMMRNKFGGHDIKSN